MGFLLLLFAIIAIGITTNSKITTCLLYILLKGAIIVIYYLGKYKVIGYIMCRVEFGMSEWERLKLTRKGHIVSFAVVPEYRGYGVGEELLLHALKGMVDYQNEEAYLEVRATNTPAIKLYGKLGFQRRRTINRYYLDGENAVIMSKQLKPDIV